MGKTFNKTWQHSENEAELYKNWEAAGYFKPEISGKLTADNSKLEASAKPFVIAIPPPNITGKLHIGHAYGTTLEDLMIRYHRLLGEPSLWIPGMDHAGIATQTVVDKELRKKGINKNEIGRKKFEEEVWKWKEEYGGKILQQLRAIGASCDWSRERFTLDAGLSDAVREAFVHLYKKDLIYRGEYIVNWCPKCGTAIADDEVEYEPQKAKLYFFKYDKNFPITIATTRPETKLGDTGVAVNPDDERYSEFVGREFEIDLDGVKGKVKIIADRAVDKDFGTGAVGITPAHSMADWRLAEDHNLEKIKVIDGHGRMTDEAGKYAGMKVLEAREKLVEYLKSASLLDKEEEIENNLSICYRCESPIEPLPSLQWFVKMEPLAAKAKEAVKSGKIKIIPKRFEKVYFHWLDNIRDWCISRQLWWGHRLPVWYKLAGNPKSKIGNSKQTESNSNIQNPKVSNLENSNLDIVSNFDIRASDFGGEIFVGKEPPQDSENWRQDEDVLDTWFSSALWPFSTLGWPEAPRSLDEVGPSFAKATEGKTGGCKSLGLSYAPGITECDYAYFFPTSVLETGYDILFFWVARMIMMSLELTGEIPFETVYLHGLVRDEKNRKLSKSLGNVLDPLDLIAKYGTDALRMALIVGSTPGQDLAVDEAKIKGYRNFSNKIWNASRFVSLRVTDGDLQSGELGESRIDLPAGEAGNLELSGELLTPADKKILDEHNKVIKSVTDNLNKFKFSYAGERLYEYFWHSFCDRYIEESKKQLDNSVIARSETTKQSGQEKIATPDKLAMTINTKKILIKILSESLVLMHPYIPFVTEAVWQSLREFCPGLSESIMISTWPK